MGILWDAIECAEQEGVGFSSCTINRWRDWWLVASPLDWLTLGTEYSPSELFQRLIPRPSAYPNTTRSEILLTAFATRVVTATPRGRLEIKGATPEDDPLWEYLIRIDEWQRVVAFEFLAAEAGKSGKGQTQQGPQGQ